MCTVLDKTLSSLSLFVGMHCCCWSLDLLDCCCCCSRSVISCLSCEQLTIAISFFIVLWQLSICFVVFFLFLFLHCFIYWFVCIFCKMFVWYFMNLKWCFILSLYCYGCCSCTSFGYHWSSTIITTNNQNYLKQLAL